MTGNTRQKHSPWRATGIMSLVALAFAVWQALGAPGADRFQQNSPHAALVNDRPITLDAHRRAMDAVQADRRLPLTDADHARILDILIAEELLLQQAERLGLADSDQGARKAQVDAMMQSIMNTTDRPPAAGELEDWYANNGDLLREPVRLQLVAVKTAAERDSFASRVANGADFLQAATDTKSGPVLTTGDKYLPHRGLINLLPPAVVRSVLPLAAGDIAGPIGDDNWFIWILGKKGGALPPLATIRERAEFEWLRQRQNQAVDEYVAKLRGQSRILVSPARGTLE